MMTDDRLIKIPEAASIAACSVRSIQRALAERRLKKIRVRPRVVRIRLADLNSYLEGNSEGGEMAKIGRLKK